VSSGDPLLANEVVALTQHATLTGIVTVARLHHWPAILGSSSLGCQCSQRRLFLVDGSPTPTETSGHDETASWTARIGAVRDEFDAPGTGVERMCRRPDRLAGHRPRKSGRKGAVQRPRAGRRGGRCPIAIATRRSRRVAAPRPS